MHCTLKNLFSCLVMSNSLQPHGLQHKTLPNSLHLSKFGQANVYWVDDVIQPSYPLSPPSPPAFNLSQHQGPFQWVSSSHQVAKVLELQLQHQVISMNIQDWLPLGLISWISLQSKGLSGVFSNTTVQKHRFFDTQLSLWSNSHIHTWLLEKP